MSHVTRTPLSRSKGQRSTCRGRGGAYCGGLPHSLLLVKLWLFTDEPADVHGDEHRSRQDDAAGAASARPVQSTQHQEARHRGEISTAVSAVRKRHRSRQNRTRDERTVFYTAKKTGSSLRGWLQLYTIRLRLDGRGMAVRLLPFQSQNSPVPQIFPL